MRTSSRRALDKLAAHGGASIDYDGNVTAGSREWRAPYAMQSSLRQEQLEKVMRFAEGGRCRMGALVEHFGDVDDAVRRCGLCDFCAPADAIAQVFRPLTDSEEQTVLAIARALRSVQGMSTGKLHKQLFPRDQMHRDDFEAILVAMTGGGYATLEDAEFEKDGRTVTYRKASLTDEGEELYSVANLRLFIPDTNPTRPNQPRTLFSRSSPKSPKQGSQANAAPLIQEQELHPSELDLEKKLKAWRLEEAKK